MKMFSVAAAILAIAVPPTHACTIVLNNGSAALMAQTGSEGVFRNEAATTLFDETRADTTGAVAQSPTVDNPPDQTPDGPMAGQGNLLSLVVAVIAPCPVRPSQAFGICPYGIVAPRD